MFRQCCKKIGNKLFLNVDKEITCKLNINRPEIGLDDGWIKKNINLNKMR